MARILQAEENGVLTIPRDVLGDGAPHARYVVESRSGVVTVRPAGANTRPPRAPNRPGAGADSWDEEWDALADLLAREWPVGLSALSAIHDVRR
jgi:hypothetical protein